MKKRLYDAGVSRIEIERAANRINVTIHTAQPGMVIGKGGSEVEALRQALTKMTGKKVHINISEVNSRSWMLRWWQRTSRSSWSAAFLSGGP